MHFWILSHRSMTTSVYVEKLANGKSPGEPKPHSLSRKFRGHYITNPNNALLLMEEILHHLGCRNLVNNGITDILTGAGFQPSTVLQGKSQKFTMHLHCLIPSKSLKWVPFNDRTCTDRTRPKKYSGPNRSQCQKYVHNKKQLSEPPKKNNLTFHWILVVL